MTRKQRRMTILGSAMTVIVVAVALVLVALNDKIVFFYSPSELETQMIKPNQTIRLGGLVVDGSIEHLDDGLVNFAVTDFVDTVSVSYQGILPALFREGQCTIAEGVLTTEVAFQAKKVLAKHDENYVPAEVEDAMHIAGERAGANPCNTNPS